MYRNFEEVLAKAKSMEGTKISVAAAADLDVLEAVKDASEMGLAEFILVGDKAKIEEIAGSIGLDLSKQTIVDEPNPIAAARKAVEFVSSKKAKTLMKGMIGTADFLRAVLDKEIGLRTGKLLSHVAIVKSEKYDRLLYVTDCAMCVAPTLQEKIQIIQNTVDVAHKLDNPMPKVACIGAVEVVNPNMQPTVDAALLAKMSDRKQIKGCIVDGPFGLDNAVSQEAATHKGVGGPVAGNADIILCPNIEVGNAMYKSLVYFADVEMGAIISGAAAPIVLTSRADSPRTKLLSIATSIVVAG